MTDRELMQMALDALEKLNKDGWILADFEEEVYASIEALRARLAQPEQEPVATLFGSLPVYDVSPKRRKPPTQDLSAPLTVNGVPMYPQREWQTLTDEEMFSLWVKCPAETEDRFAFARAIEQALKEKNNG